MRMTQRHGTFLLRGLQSVHAQLAKHQIPLHILQCASHPVVATCFNSQILEALDPASYRNQAPYPWINPEGILTPEGFEALRRTLPDVSLFTKRQGRERRAGQIPHDRYTLKYNSDTQVDEPWRSFIDELVGDRYRRCLCRLLPDKQRQRHGRSGFE